VATEKRSLAIEARVNDLATSAFSKMLAGARGFANGAVGAFNAAAAAVRTVVDSVRGAFEDFRQHAEELDKLAKISDKFGVTAESLTAIRNGAELAGVGVEELAAAVKNFEKAVSEADDGGKKQIETLRRLGLTAEDFAGDQIDLVDVLAKVAGGLEGVDSAADRTRILIDLFGKTGANLAPLLKEGADGIQNLAAQARSAGAVFSREDLARVEQFNDSWTALKQTFRTMAEQLVSVLSPAFTKFFTKLNEFANSEFVRSAFTGLLSFLVEVYNTLESIVDRIELTVASWRQLALSVQIFGAEVSGNEEKIKKLNQALFDQKLYVEQLRFEWGRVSPAVEEMRKSVEKLRKTPAPEPPKIPTRRELTGGSQESVEVLPNAWDSFLEGARKAREAWTDFTAAAMDAGQRIVGGSLDSITRSIAIGLEGTKSWNRVWKDWGQQVRGIISSVIAKLLVVRALSGLSSLFGGTTTTTPAPTVADGAAVGGGVGGAVGGGAGVGALSAGGSTPRFTLLPGTKSGAAPASSQSAGPQIVINMSFSSIDPKGSFEIIKQNKDQIVAIVASAMQRSNAFRGTVKEASS